MDDRGALFDLTADPAQRTDLAGQDPGTVTRLREAVAAWRKDVGVPPGGVVPDDRPYPVGYAAFPTTPLPARDGIPHGGVKRSASAPNCSYFVNWKSLEDRMTWEIEVNTTGEYEVMIPYTCPLADAGSTVELIFKGAVLSGVVTPGWDPPLYTNQDTIPRPAAESQMKEFRPLRPGTIHLEKGRGQLTLRARKIPGQSVMDVRGVYLTLKK